MWKCSLHSFKAHDASLQGILHILYGYCPCKNTLHCPKGLLLLRRVCCISVLTTAFVGRYGDVVIILKTSSIVCGNCVLLKGHCSSILLRQSEHLDTASSNTYSLVDMNTASFAAYALKKERIIYSFEKLKKVRSGSVLRSKKKHYVRLYRACHTKLMSIHQIMLQGSKCYAFLGPRKRKETLAAPGFCRSPTRKRGRWRMVSNGCGCWEKTQRILSQVE